MGGDGGGGAATALPVLAVSAAPSIATRAAAEAALAQEAWQEHGAWDAVSSVMGGEEARGGTAEDEAAEAKAVEEKVRQWMAARRKRDFQTADGIRADLRTIGIEAEKAAAAMTASAREAREGERRESERQANAARLGCKRGRRRR